MVTQLHIFYNNITKKNTFSNTLTLVLLVFCISIFLRLILAYQTYDSPWHILNKEFLSILSPDAALYGYYAKLLLTGLPHTSDVNLIEFVIYYLVKYTPFTIDQVLYFGPAFFASLVVIPTMLIAKIYFDSRLVIVAIGISSSIGFGYYSRTYLGYFDTDVLNTFFPLMALFGMILTIKTNNFRYILISGIASYLYLAWYHSSEPLVYGMVGWFIVYGVVFHFKNSEIYKASIVLALSIVPISFEYQLVLLAIVFIFFHFLSINYKYFLALFLVALGFALYKIDIGQFAFHANRYLFKGETFSSGNYNFLSPMQLVAEAITVDYKEAIQLLAGNTFIFVLSVIGYVYMIVKKREFILALPLLVLGLVSLKAGLRFHIYGVSVLMISFWFLFYDRLVHYQTKKIYLYGVIILLFSCVSFENYKSVKYWNTQVAIPVFTPTQVQVLNQLKKIGSPKDHIVTWWDYGWPLWYYTQMKTLIDNGRHHQDNYIVSKIFLTDSQKESNHLIHLFYEASNNLKGSAFQTVQRKHKDMQKVFETLKTKDMTKKKTSQKYLLIPFQMIKTLYTIYNFSNLDIKTGKAYSKNIFWEKDILKEDNNAIYLSGGHSIDKRKGTYKTSTNEFFIKNIYQIKQKGVINKITKNKGHKNGLELIMYNGVMGKKLYTMDKKFFNSVFVQMFFFDNYDKKYFEKMITTDQIKLFRVK